MKGRALVAIGLGAFVVMTALVVWRRSVGVATAREMRIMENEKRSLRAQLVTLDNDRRRAVSRAAVIKEAERRLGLHVATESQTRTLPDSMLPR
jgi:Flp pilus assembly protein TadB